MILGKGDIAKALIDLPGGSVGNPKWIWFACGVSNSREKRESQYQREIDLLLAQDRTKHLVYFGSLAIFYNPTTRYVRHKKHMEELVKKYFKHYTIVRMGNITWGKNPHTLVNYFKNAVKQGKRLEIKDTHRYLVDKAEFGHWMGMLPDWNCEMNITGKKMKVAAIVKKYTYRR